MSDSNNVRVLRMNELSSDRYEDVPLPARQQLGDFNNLVDVDARSGNGLRDYDLRVDSAGRDYEGADSVHSGAHMMTVTYHLDTTPAPENGAADGPGSRTYAKHQAHSRVLQEELGAQPHEGLLLETHGNATRAYQTDSEYISTQREIPGRNERYAHAVGMEDETGASAAAGSGSAALTIPSQTAAEVNNDVPAGTIASVKSWVGEDKSKARRALDVEQSRETPRNTLVEWLQDRLDNSSDSK